MKNVNADRAREIRALKRMKESEIDTTDIRSISDWSKAIAGEFYRPIKKPLTIQRGRRRSRVAQRAGQWVSDTN
jgi:hypothetical protein